MSLCRSVIVMVALVCVVLPDLARLATVYEFLLNKHRIVTELCEAREAEVNTCQGACHLKKKMTEVDTGSDEGKDEPLELQFPELLIVPQSEHALSPLFEKMEKAFEACNECALQNYITAIDHPPRRLG